MNARNILIEDQENLDLFQSVAEFNLYLVRFIHSSWLKTIKLSPLVRQLRNGGNADYHLSHYLLKQFKLNNDFDYEFESSLKRVALADETALLKLALHLGIILNEEVIRGVIKRKERQALEKCLGHDAYRFAVKKAQFIGRAEGQAGPCILIDWNHLERFKHFLTRSGLQMMGKAFEGCSDAFHKRLSLKLPKMLSESLKEAGDVTVSSEQCRMFVVKTHKEVNRKWRHLSY